jgi:hypothetical protein
VIKGAVDQYATLCIVTTRNTTDMQKGFLEVGQDGWGQRSCNIRESVNVAMQAEVGSMLSLEWVDDWQRGEERWRA